MNRNRILRRYLPILLVLILVVLDGLIFREVYLSKEAKSLKVYFLDVGQGDSILIVSPSGNTMLIDGGPSTGASLREVGKILPMLDRTLGVVLATHPDSDHIGGLSQVLSRYDTDFYIESGNKSDTSAFRSLEDELNKEPNVKKVIARRGQIVDFGDGVELKIIYPDRDVSNDKSNDASIVAKLSYGRDTFLFTGDSPSNIEKYIVSSYGNDLQSEVLKAGHHGSRTSSSSGFVGKVSPYWAIISSGRGNKYGHPHKEVVDLFNSLNIKVLRTDELGTIEMDSMGDGIFIK
jgi:competence protein ComEC